jgi:hypothetical protein
MLRQHKVWKDTGLRNEILTPLLPCYSNKLSTHWQLYREANIMNSCKRNYMILY